MSRGVTATSSGSASGRFAIARGWWMPRCHRLTVICDTPTACAVSACGIVPAFAITNACAASAADVSSCTRSRIGDAASLNVCARDVWGVPCSAEYSPRTFSGSCTSTSPGFSSRAGTARMPFRVRTNTLWSPVVRSVPPR